MPPAASNVTAAHSVDLGAKQLHRLEVFLDVVYALLFVEMLRYLPAAEDMAWASLSLPRSRSGTLSTSPPAFTTGWR